MTDKKMEIRDPDMQKVEAALIRAGKKARERSIRNNTPFIVYKEGKIVDLNAPQKQEEK